MFVTHTGSPHVWLSQSGAIPKVKLSHYVVWFTSYLACMKHSEEVGNSSAFQPYISSARVLHNICRLPWCGTGIVFCIFLVVSTLFSTMDSRTGEEGPALTYTRQQLLDPDPAFPHVCVALPEEENGSPAPEQGEKKQAIPACHHGNCKLSGKWNGWALSTDRGPWGMQTLMCLSESVAES